VAAAESALSKSKSPRTRFLAGRVLAVAGKLDAARALAAGLEGEAETGSRAFGKLLGGEIALQEGDAARAIQVLAEANRITDTWIGHFALGRAYAEAGAFDKGEAELARCIERRGEATELFMDDVPTYGLFPGVLYWQGRVREGLRNPASAESYRRYVEIRGKAGEDPLLAEIKRRAGL